MDEVIFDVDGEPIPASRPRVTSRGVTYYPKRHKERQKTLNDALEDSPALHTKRPVEVRILCVMPPYKTSSHPVHRSDVDNLSKLPMDCMTKSGRYWKDDDLVVNLMALKRFAREGEEPHTKIRIIPIEGDVEDRVDEAFYG